MHYNYYFHTTPNNENLKWLLLILCKPAEFCLICVQTAMAGNSEDVQFISKPFHIISFAVAVINTLV